jgi:hypothetical protein
LVMPGPGVNVTADAHSLDGRQAFVFNVYRSRLTLSKCFYNKRVRGGDNLVRVCLGATQKHRNPDSAVISGSHIHLYREGYDDRWAFPLPPAMAACLNNPTDMLMSFMAYCNVTNCPQMQGGMF